MIHRGMGPILQMREVSDDGGIPTRRELFGTPSVNEKEASTTKLSVDTVLDSHGCVVCPTTPQCPQCADNEECSMTTQTCDKCPTTYCEAIVETTTTTNTLSSAEVGGIAGGISGFFFLVVIIGLYFLFRKYRKNLDADYEYGIGEEMKGLSGFDDDEDYADPAQRRRISQKNNENKRMSQNSLSTMTNSVFTKASNVLNIAYVPGVTSRPTKPPSFMSRRSRKPGSLYSKTNSVYSKETYFSDLENASFHGGKVATKGGNPTLINLRQDEYDYDDGNDEYEEYELDSQYGFDNKYEESRETEEPSNDETMNMPLNISLQLPGRRNVDNYIIEENEDTDDGLIELEEEESDKDVDHEFNDINIDIGMSNIVETNRNQRSMPTRYAALLEKSDKTKQITDDMNPFSSKHAINNNISDAMKRPVRAANTDTNSDSYSEVYTDSDSDEENIEFLLQQSAQTTNGTHASFGTNSNTNTNTTTPSRGNSTLKGYNNNNSSSSNNTATGGSIAVENPFGDD